VKKRHRHKRPAAALKWLPRVSKDGTPSRHIIAGALARGPAGCLQEFSLHATKGYRSMRA